MFATRNIRPIAAVIKAPEENWTQLTATEERYLANNAARKAEAARKADMNRMLSQFRR